jgi:hypothetical protein
MPSWLSLALQFLRNANVQIGAAVVALTVILLLLTRRKRPTAEELEQRRRLTVYRQGRLIDGIVTDIDGDTIHFAYSVNGAEYHATQDVNALRDKLPHEPHRAIGPATLRYIVRNPANSIVICEEWSGLREAP